MGAAAGLVGGVIGGVLGSFVGMPAIGFMIGSMVGSLLFPAAQPDGPKLDNLKLSTSAYGQMIPISYGVMRLPTNVIWQTDLKEHRHGGGGKGGGGGPTTFTYSASFRVRICEGPMGGVLRIWADAITVYDTRPGSTVDNSQIPVTVYLGGEDQLPDPTEEAELGAGNVPAYRGFLDLTFADWDLSPYGNRIPAISVEVFSLGEGIPNRVNTWTPPFGTDPLPRNAWRGVGYDNGIITITTYNNGTPTFNIPGGPIPYRTQTFTLDGTPIDDNTITVHTLGDGTGSFFQANNNSHIATAQQNGVGTGIGASAFYIDGGPSGSIFPPIGADQYYAITERPVVVNDYLFATGGSPVTAWIARWPAPGGDPGPIPDASYIFSGSLTGAGMRTTLGDDGNIYVASTDERRLYTFDQDLNLLAETAVNSLPTDFISGGGMLFMVSHGNLMYSRIAAGILPEQAVVLSINTDLTFTEIGAIPAAWGDLYKLNECLALCRDGVISMCPPAGPVTLASIVRDQSTRAGLTATQIDVSTLTEFVDGYVINNQGDVRSNLLQLQSTWFFDGVESSGHMKYVKRGQASVITIPDDDLAANDGGEPPALAEITRANEIALPAILNIKYVNAAADYQNGLQMSQRQVTRSQLIHTIELAINMTAAKAKQVASALLYSAWGERTSSVIRIPRKYAHLEPTDVINARGRDLRIVHKSDQVKNIIEIEGVSNLTGIWTQAPIGTDGDGFSSSNPPSAQATQLVLLDIPLVTDADTPGYYVAMAGATDDTWRGATLFRSTDTGVTWNEVMSSNTASVIGQTSTILGNFAGGNIFDEGNVATVVIGNGGGELASSTELAVLGGANLAVIGQELVQFKTATLIADSTYELSGLLRGRRGTEWATSGHVVGERFVLLPVSVVAMPLAEINHTYAYRAVTFRRALASSTSVNFANTGNAIKCYSPTDVGGGCDASGNVTMNWKRRTRIGGQWVDYIDAPLSEAVEAYIVQIWDATYTICGRIISGLTTQTCSYTAAQQVTDFGAVQQTVFFTVGQVGAFTLGSQTRGSAPSTGGSNNAPLVSIPPYVSPPLIPPVPPTSGPVDGTLSWPSDSKVIPMTIGQRKVYSFTTGASIPNTGTIAVSEYGTTSLPTPRHCFIATDSSGVNKVPLSESYNGTTATSYIGAGAGGAILAASTTYYYVFDFMRPDGTLSGPPGADGQTILNLGNVT